MLPGLAIEELLRLEDMTARRPRMCGRTRDEPVADVLRGDPAMAGGALERDRRLVVRGGGGATVAHVAGNSSGHGAGQGAEPKRAYATLGSDVSSSTPAP